MKEWWQNLSLHIKLNIVVQATLLIILLLVQMWVVNKLETQTLEEGYQHALGRATQSFLSLNAMMLSNTIGNKEMRATLFKRMAAQDDVVEFHLVRAEAIQHQFGAGNLKEIGQDAIDHAAISTGTIQTDIVNGGKHTMRVVVPFKASKEFHGVNCLSSRCHQTTEGTVLGAVSLTVSLDREYKELKKFGLLLLAGQVMLQLLLFMLIGWLIRTVIQSVYELKKTMLDVQGSGDFSRRVKVKGYDEIGKISLIFNEFIAQIENLHQLLEEKMIALREYHDRTEEQLRIGSDIMTHITNGSSTHDPDVRIKTYPISHYSGDIILVSRTPLGDLHILLADAVGHGLTAAMNLLPMSLTFNAMTKKGLSVSCIVEEMNSSIHRLMSVDRFICAIVISVDFRNRLITVWNGGIPAPMLVGADGTILHRWLSHNLPLGILSEDDFSSKTEVFHYAQDSQLLLFSDGLPEAESRDGEQFGSKRIEELMQQTDLAHRFDLLAQTLDQHLQGGKAHDDVCFALVNIGTSIEQAGIVCDLGLQRPADQSSVWRFEMSLGANELKYIEVVPMLLQIITNINANRGHKSKLYLILSELFNNALDHGVLQLDSRIKQSTQGFEDYFQLREQRLRTLDSGKIGIEIEKVVIEGMDGVKIRIIDSGSGFDYAAIQANTLDQVEQAQHGRGIALIKALVYKLEFVQRGNEVIAYYVYS